MSIIDDLWKTIKNHSDQIRNLKGRLDSISIGRQIIPGNIPGFVEVPSPTAEGQLMVSNDDFVWILLPVSIPAAGQRNVLSTDNGDLRPNYNASLATATPEPVDAGAGAVGVSLLAARQDHDHPFSATATGRYRQFVYEVSGGDFTFIIDDVGNPVMALEDLE